MSTRYTGAGTAQKKFLPQAQQIITGEIIPKSHERQRSVTRRTRRCICLPLQERAHVSPLYLYIYKLFVTLHRTKRMWRNW